MSPGKTLDSEGREKIHAKGEDQLFSFKGVLAEQRSAVISGAGGYVESDPCPAGTIWCVTNVVAYDWTSATTAHAFALNHDDSRYQFGASVAEFAAKAMSYWGGWKWLAPSDTIRVTFAGALVGDTCYVEVTGKTMTLEA